ncbi:unnamed protein product [Caenorhabditis sp. 36 PRJEB53466]|nr:unnamed protein product [Caenorhabditis sp. 36 PRJEB53466]
MGEDSEKPGEANRTMLQAAAPRRTQGEDGEVERSHACGIRSREVPALRASDYDIVEFLWARTLRSLEKRIEPCCKQENGILMGEDSEKLGEENRTMLQAGEVRRRQGEDGEVERSHACGIRSREVPALRASDYDIVEFLWARTLRSLEKRIEPCCKQENGILMGEDSEKLGEENRTMLQAGEVRRRQGEDGEVERSHACGIRSRGVPALRASDYDIVEFLWARTLRSLEKRIEPCCKQQQRAEGRERTAKWKDRTPVVSARVECLLFEHLIMI